MCGESWGRLARHVVVQRLCDCIALILLLYGSAVDDLLLLLGSGAVLIGSLSRYLALLCIDLPKPLCGALRAFSLTVLSGAIFLSFW